MKTIKDYLRIFKDFIFKYYIMIIIIGIYILLSIIFHFTSCISKLLIGIPCPGCGITRAFLCLIKFDFKGVVYYNPLIFIVPIICWIIIFKERPIINKIYKSRLFWILIMSLILIVYIIRFIYIFPNSPMEYYENNLLEYIKRIFK